jgi:hypothetical protein
MQQNFHQLSSSFIFLIGQLSFTGIVRLGLEFVVLLLFFTDLPSFYGCKVGTFTTVKCKFTAVNL